MATVRPVMSVEPTPARLHAKRDHVLSTKHETFTGKEYPEVPGMMRVEPHSEPSAAREYLIASGCKPGESARVGCIT